MRKVPPITWNGIAPRPGSPDVLWDLLQGVLVLLANQGEALRFQRHPAGLPLRCQLQCQGHWWESVPPFWDAPRLIDRLITLVGRNWWDRWQLRIQQRHQHRWGTYWVWERPIALGLEGAALAGRCRVRCYGAAVEVKLTISSQRKKIADAAAKAFDRWEELYPWSKMLDAFL